MDIDIARADLARASRAGPAANRAAPNLNAARTILIDFGIEAFGLPRADVRSLDDIVRIATEAPSTQARRDFAVLLVHAFGISGLLPHRGETEQAIRSFLERALLNALRRAGYPFAGTPYDKRQALADLHVTIDEHLRPLEPSFPRWLQGTDAPDEA